MSGALRKADAEPESLACSGTRIGRRGTNRRHSLGGHRVFNFAASALFVVSAASLVPAEDQNCLRRPPVPRLDLTSPAFTKEDPFRLKGMTEPEARIVILGGLFRTTTLADRRGRFSVPVSLRHRERNDLEVFAIACRGAGRRGFSAHATVTHDDVAPTLTSAIEPPPNPAGWNRTDVRVTFSCADGGSGIASCPDPAVVTGEGAGLLVTGTAADHAGNTASITVALNIDRTAPTITATLSPPANENGWNNTDVEVRFDCADPLSGVTSCPAPVVKTTEGAGQAVTATVTDRAGNSATTSLVLNIDKTPPTIAASALPVPNAEGWNNTEVEVRFDCADALSGIESCPSPSTAAEDGTDLVVSGTVTDRAGNSASARVALDIDTTPPTVTASFSPPPNAAGWNRSDVTVAFECADLTSGIVACPQGASVTAEGADQLVSGAATDRAGNSFAVRLAVDLDRTPPSLSLASPADGSTVNASPVRVRGTAGDVLSGLEGVTCNGASASLSDGGFTCEVSLAEGPNPITVLATDTAGNAVPARLTVNFLPRPVLPVVTVTSPASLSVFRSGPVTVSGTVDQTDVTVSVNGVAATVSGGGFTAEGVPLREGHNVLTATARNAAGRVGSGSVTVTLDLTPPTIGIDAPTDGAILAAPQVTVTGMINDIVSGTVNAAEATVTVNGVPAVVSNRSFVAADVLLARGRNTITAVARDRAGNEARTRIEVTVADVARQQRLEVLLGNSQTGMIGTTLPEPLVVALVDAFGRPLSGQPVTFTVARTDGIVRAFPDEGRSVSVLTDERGQAAAEFQLGMRTGAGNNQVAVTAPGVVGELVFCASATAGPPAEITADAVMGESFRGAAGAPLAVPFVVIVLDRGGNPAAGAPVAFTVLEGGGTLEGETSLTRLTSGDGKAAATLTLGEEAGINNNVVTASLEGAIPVTFKATGVSSGPAIETRVSGVVLDNANQPIPGATAKIVGAPLQARTDAQGRFSISGAPVGTIHLIVDGATSTRPETFPFLAFTLTTIAGQDNTLGMPIFIPPLETQNAKVVGGDEEVVLVMEGVPGVAFTVFPRSVTFPDGSKLGPMTLSQVHADKVPMPPPYGTAPRVVWTLQPAGAHFDPPIRVQLPNVDNLPPGQVLEVFQFDHDLEQFVSVGAARVSEDGAVLVSDPGFGITKSGWGAAPPPPPQKTCVGGCDDKDQCTDDKCENGTCKHTPITAMVTITKPPDNPNPGDGSFGSNFSFLAQRAFANTASGDTIQVEAKVSPSSLDAKKIEWMVMASAGGVRSEIPADRKGPTFSFIPDPPAHPPYRPHGGSRFKSNPFSYAIRARICKAEKTHTIAQDQLDIIRQEYQNHGIGVPARGEFNAATPTRSYTAAEINNTAYSVIRGNPGPMVQAVRDVYNRMLHDDLQRQPVGTMNLDPNAIVVDPGAQVQIIGAVLDTPKCNGAPNPATCDDVVVGQTIRAGPNRIAETRAVNQVTDFHAKLNSTWRNPERNEAVGSVVVDSNHQHSNTADMDVDGSPVPGKTRVQLNCILQTAADNAGFNGFTEMNSLQIICTSSAVTHVHVQPR